MSATTYLNNGLDLARKGNLQQAAASFHQAIAQNPNYGEAYNNLGVIQTRMKRLSEAVHSFHQAIRLNPDNAAAYNNLGIVQSEAGDLDAAVHSFRQATCLKPDHPPFFNNLGIVLDKAALLEEAAAAFRRAIALSPDYPEALNNLGTVLRKSHLLPEAEDCLRKALVLRPNYAKAYNNLGLVLKTSFLLEDAIACLRRAQELEPSNPEILNNLGVALKESRRLAEAESCLHQAIKLRPDFADAHFSLAVLYLLQEEYEKGWDQYDDLRLVKAGDWRPPAPRWRGEDLAGRRILLYADQGFGDTIHFARYAPMVAAMATETFLWVQQPLERLLAISQPNYRQVNDKTVAVNHYDYCCPLPSLPQVFKTDKESIPGIIPYLQPSHEKVAAWEKKLATLDGGGRYRVGVVWAGNPAHNNDRNRSIPFDTFARLLNLSGISWVSLQVGERAADLAKAPAPIIDLSADLTDFAETAGVVANLDLVISVDSAVAHLAGALGRQIWLLVPHNPDWRWQLDRADSPWYPSMRLFRQQKPGNWAEVLAKIAAALPQLLR
ncbi:MAG: tetratricopeptide repeat-containing glycosyltransferase family protein [Negativicutes bacterium]|nr:tetratricopeptide repeat-containing glycosyltransferase family protein [Negativicutes bacterium]